MKTAAIILGILSAVSMCIWAQSLFRIIKTKKPEVRKTDREFIETSTRISGAAISKEIRYEKSKGREISFSEGQSYDELADGLRRRDPGAILFIRIAAGFGVGLLSGVAAIGAAVVAAGNSDGYFMMGFSVFFTLVFTAIIIDQHMHRTKKP